MLPGAPPGARRTRLTPPAALQVKDKVFEEMLEQEHGRVRPNSRAAELAKNLKVRD